MSETEAVELAPIAVRPREAARLLGISPATLRRLTDAGEIASFSTSGPGSARLIRLADLKAWVDRKALPGRTGR